MDSIILKSAQLMLYGLGGVFASLAILYISVKIMTKIFPGKE